MVRLPGLEAKTVTFIKDFLSSDIPAVIRESALFNLSTLRTQTCFRTVDGYFFGFEGSHEYQGCSLGSCTHVWTTNRASDSYLASSREVCRRLTSSIVRPDEARSRLGSGCQSRRVCSQMLFDEHWLTVRRTIAFCWIDHGWDADQGGVIEGCQHNTMDVGYFGPNPQMGFWYLGALRSDEEMAYHAGDSAFAAHCRRLLRGREVLDGRQSLQRRVFRAQGYFSPSESRLY